MYLLHRGLGLFFGQIQSTILYAHAIDLGKPCIALSDQPRARIMVRHKKDNFSSKGKKYSTSGPRHRGSLRDGNDEGSSSRPPFKAACWDFGHCDPKRCSGKRLIQFGQMRELAVGQKSPGVVIS